MSHWVIGRGGGEYVGETVELRFAPLRPDLPLLLYVDGARVCEVFPLDRLANHRRPRRDLPQPEPAAPRSRKGPLDYIDDEYQALLRAFGDDLDEADAPREAGEPETQDDPEDRA